LDPNDDSMTLNVRLPAKMFDRYDAVARRIGVSVPELVRRALRRSDRQEPPR
jgi:predicted HicB family RNase H-like nuclease